MPVALLNPYCTLAQLREELKNSDAANDDVFNRSINEASRWVDDYTGRDFFEHAYVAVPLEIDKHDDLIFDELLFLPYKPILTLQTVIEAGVALAVNVDYIQKPEVLVRIGGKWFAGELPADRIKLTGWFGYDQDANPAVVPLDIPEQVRKATLIVAAVFSGQYRKEVVGLDGQKTVIEQRTIPDTVKDMLRRKQPLFM